MLYFYLKGYEVSFKKLLSSLVNLTLKFETNLSRNFTS